MKSGYLPKFNHSVWSLFVVIAIIDFFLFRSYVLRNVATYYPGAFDQAVYLQMCYSLYENIHQYGWIQGFTQSNILHNGILFQVQTTLLFLLAGASRLDALLPNFLYFVLLQMFAIATISTITKKSYFIFSMFGLILCLNTPFFNAGDLMDFRMDFIAFCMYGIFVYATLKSNIFYDRKWSLIAGMIAGILILLRCITLVYLTGIITTMIAYFYYRSHKQYLFTEEQKMIKARFFNLLLIVALIMTVTLPYLWLNKESIYNYYVVSHVMNEKSFRTLEAGITDTFSFLTYYPSSLLLNHIGLLCLANLILLLCPYLLIRFNLINHRSRISSSSNIAWSDSLIFLGVCLLIPLGILTLDPNKSPVVGSIMVIPFLCLIVWYCVYVDSTLVETTKTKIIFNTIATIIILSGIYNQLHNFNHFNSKYKQKNVSSITKMYQDIGDYAIQHHFPEINLSLDQIRDYLTSSGIEVVYYETKKKLVPTNVQRLGGSNYAFSKADAIESLNNSNVVILNLNDYPNDSVYPFNLNIQKIKPFLFKYAESHFTRLGDYQFMNSTFRVYVSRKIKS